MRFLGENKKLIRRCIVLGVIVLALAAVYIAAAPRVIIDSSDGSWKAVFYVYGPHRDWKGTLIYTGEADIGGISTETSYNGDFLPSLDMEQALTSLPGTLPWRMRVILAVDESDCIFFPLIHSADEPQNVKV